MLKAVLISVIFLLLISCFQKEPKKVLAQVNKEELSEEDLKANFSADDWERLSQEAKKEMVLDWIELTLLAQEADGLMISEQRAIVNRIETAQKNIKANALIAQKLAEIKVTEDDLFNYYRVHKSQYQKTHPEYKVQRIFVTDDELLPQIRDEIQNSSFEDAAKIYSEESLGSNGGYLGFVAESQIDKILWDTLKSLRIYTYKTVETKDGFYIIRYYDRREVKTEKTFQEVVDEIRKNLVEKRKNEIYLELIESLKKKSVISISI